MTEMVIALSTPDGRRVEWHSYVDHDQDGSVRDANHALDCVREFVSTDGLITEGRPSGRVLFEIRLGIRGTRRGTSAYTACRYQKFEPCPQNVAEAGMDVFYELKHVLRRAKKAYERKAAEK